MAYGKIKADSIIYDNSGSDVEKTIATLADPTPEGTAVKSTTNGNETNTSYLRADGDGTCSWQSVPVPTTITVADESSDTTCNVLFTTAATGNLAPKSGTNLTFNSNTGILTATGFAGDITGDVTGNVTGNTSGSSGSCTGNAATASTASTVNVAANNSTDETVYPVFVDGATGSQEVESDTGLTYNPSTGLLSTAAVTTTGNVIVGGNLTVSGSTTTVNTATLEVEDKNIELGKVSSPSDTTADGGGITLKGASDKTFNWVDATDAWTSSEHIHVGDSKKLLVGTGSDMSIYHDGTNSIINNNTGDLYIQTDNNLKIEAKDGGNDMIHAIPTAQVELHYNGVKRFQTTSTGAEAIGTLSDDKGDVRSIPQNTQAGAYTLVASDAGKHILAGGNITWADNTFSAGQAVTIINNSGSDITITRGNTAVQYNTADAVNGNKTLAGRGMATIIFASGTLAYISGSGLS